MGLLDDAIREHLELKRRHGADPGEIERQEHEVLGASARRSGEPRDDAAEPETVGHEPADVAEEPAAVALEGADEPADIGPETPAGDEPAAIAAGAAPEPADEVQPPAAEGVGREEDPWLEEEQEPAVEREEDVLEETPEFLQETPEHDRLWFEQKPPRDFDWER